MYQIFKVVVTALILHPGFVHSENNDWMRYRGPNGSGIATVEDKELPVSWSEEKNMKWTTVLPGPGSSSPILSGDSVFVTCYSGYGVDRNNSGDPQKLKRHLLRINRANGNIVWNKTIEAAQPVYPYRGYITEHGYASNTPVTDGERVYAFFSKSGILAYDFDGNLLWQKQVGTQSNRKGWGSAASPILYKNLLIVNASDEGRTIFAFDKVSGNEVWKVKNDKLEYAYATPALATLPDERQELIVALPSEIWGIDPDSGKIHWQIMTQYGNNISPSVLVDGDVAYINGGYPTSGCVAVRAGGSDDASDTHLLWVGEIGSYVPTPVTFQERLYGVTEMGFAYGLNAKTGKEIFKERLPVRGGKTFYAGAVRIGEKILVVSRQGGAFVFSAKHGYEQLAHNIIGGDETDFNATPAVSNGEIYLRSNEALYCVAESQ